MFKLAAATLALSLLAVPVMAQESADFPNLKPREAHQSEARKEGDPEKSQKEWTSKMFQISQCLEQSAESSNQDVELTQTWIDECLKQQQASFNSDNSHIRQEGDFILQDGNIFPHRIDEADWYIVAVLPERLVSRPERDAMQRILIAFLGSCLALAAGAGVYAYRRLPAARRQ